MIKTKPTNLGRRPIVIAAIAIAATAVVAITLASSRSVDAGPEAAPWPAAQYLPSISDLMISTIQPRHERLWRAEQNANWEFAEYELGNLKGAFGRLGRAHPLDQGTSFSDMITSVIEQPFEELAGAIKAKDGKAFAKAYADLTDACNSCHQALNHGVVEIHIPSRTSASDLDTDRAQSN